MERKINLNRFINFTNVIHVLKVSLEDEKKRRKGVDKAIIIRDLDTDLFNVELQLLNVSHEMQNFCIEFIDEEDIQADTAHELLAAITQTREILEAHEYDQKDRRLKSLWKLEAIIEKQFDAVIQPKPPILKLKFNMPDNVLYDLLRQLKNIHFEDKAILTHSYKELAQFLISYVDGFENEKAVNLAKNIGKQIVIKKKKLKVTLEG